MLHPYQQSRHIDRPVEDPAVVEQLKSGRRQIIRLWQATIEGNETAAQKLEVAFSRWLVKEALPETLLSLAPDMHSLCDLAVNRGDAPLPACKAILYFSGALINSEQSSASVPLLTKLKALVAPHEDMAAACLLNTAIAFGRLSPRQGCEQLLHLFDMRNEARSYLSEALLLGCNHILTRLRLQNSTSDNFTALLLSGELAEQAHQLISEHSRGDSGEESRAAVVSLRTEIAAVVERMAHAGLPRPNLPSTEELLTDASLDAAQGRNPLLFIGALMNLASYYKSAAEYENARDTSTVAMIVCHSLPVENKPLVGSILTFINSLPEPEDLSEQD